MSRAAPETGYRNNIAAFFAIEGENLSDQGFIQAKEKLLEKWSTPINLSQNKIASSLKKHP